MFRMNPGHASTIVVHPSTASIALFEILQGKYSYVRGQTLHASLRNPGVFFRQVFIHLYKTALSGCTYDNVLTDWRTYEASIRTRWKDRSPNWACYRRSTFDSWAHTMRITLDQLLLNAINRVLYAKTSLFYERYIDWVVTVGLVPVVTHGPDQKLVDSIHEQLVLSCKRAASGEKTIGQVIRSLTQAITSLVSALSAIYIPSYAEVNIEYDPERNVFTASYKQKKVHVEIITVPVILGGTVIFDSPVQRLYNTVMTCHRTAEHAKLCQLLNTAPTKALVGSACNNIYKDIMTHLEQAAQKNDPKKELLNLLVKLAENKTVSGVTDVVENFVTDVSQNIVDKNKLFGTGPETTTQGLRRQVSNTVFKCLTNQINEQFDTISNLERERETCIKRIRCIESQLAAASQQDSRPAAEVNLLTANTFQSLGRLQDPPLQLASCHIPAGNTVLNSFFSSYVPPFRELTKDLTNLWESELFQTYKLVPVVDNQGQRLSVTYSQDTISILLGPFTYMIGNMPEMELISHSFVSTSLQDIASHLYQSSRLFVYITDVGQKYCMDTRQQENGAGESTGEIDGNRT
ncbi:ORF43 [Retroperitoneal fibromatosis-associated herpesvirus]|uniref:ORF43 n=1 Tax=Retroperitoneal fibromatosis-associated herpesvirus TaxID=111469 RepID=U5NIW8_9GAMA|nr:ORF43 [Retroperitoneal fibromatosis-associated herpesvirus]AGY30724.1 ORF43 [Retroperitoneal fibromatosis-associated herpesvirus]